MMFISLSNTNIVLQFNKIMFRSLSCNNMGPFQNLPCTDILGQDARARTGDTHSNVYDFSIRALDKYLQDTQSPVPK